MRFTELGAPAAVLRCLLLVVSIVVLGPPVAAQGATTNEPGQDLVSGSIAFVSDYVWRGVSQTLEEPAVQGSLELDLDGFYVNLWGSNVDYDSDAQLELDVSVGYRETYENGFGWDIGLLESAYIDESEINMLELYFGLDYRGLGLMAFYAEEYSGIDTDTLYLDLSYDLRLTDRIGLLLHVGHSSFEESSGLEDYIDYAAGVALAAVGIDFAVTWHGTDLDDVELADDRVVFSISKSL